MTIYKLPSLALPFVRYQNMCIQYDYYENVNVHVLYSLISTWVQQTLQFIALVLELSLLYGLISSGENSVHFLQLMPFTIFNFFVLPGTHYYIYWVGRGSMEWEVCPTLLHMTMEQWESNARPSDFNSNTLSTWPHAPIYTLIMKETLTVQPLYYMMKLCK